MILFWLQNYTIANNNASPEVKNLDLLFSQVNEQNQMMEWISNHFVIQATMMAAATEAFSDSVRLSSARGMVMGWVMSGRMFVLMPCDSLPMTITPSALPCILKRFSPFNNAP